MKQAQFKLTLPGMPNKATVVTNIVCHPSGFCIVEGHFLSDETRQEFSVPLTREEAALILFPELHRNVVLSKDTVTDQPVVLESTPAEQKEKVKRTRRTKAEMAALKQEKKQEILADKQEEYAKLMSEPTTPSTPNGELKVETSPVVHNSDQAG